MQVLGIDPSYSRSGIALLSDSDGVLSYSSISIPSVVKRGSIYQFSVSFPASVWHARECIEWWVSQGFGSVDAIFMEYPALSSAMGAWLLPLQCSFYRELDVAGYGSVPFYLVPPTAINSYVLPKKPKLKRGEVPEVPWVKPTGKVAKQMIVDWVRDRYGVDCDHDEASAIVLGHLGFGVLRGDLPQLKVQLVDRWYSLGD